LAGLVDGGVIAAVVAGAVAVGVGASTVLLGMTARGPEDVGALVHDRCERRNVNVRRSLAGLTFINASGFNGFRLPLFVSCHSFEKKLEGKWHE
jgi:hypothetical protein